MTWPAPSVSTFTSSTSFLCEASVLTQLFRFLDPTRAMPDLASRLRALADDIEHLRADSPVSADTLQAAPLLEYWIPASRPEGVRLIGQVEDRMILTSPVWFADPNGNWVRTLTRFYRLGPPANPGEASLISSLTIGPRDTRDDDILENET